MERRLNFSGFPGKSENQLQEAKSPTLFPDFDLSFNLILQQQWK